MIGGESVSGFWEIAHERPDEVAVIDRLGERTWGEFLDRVSRLMAAFRAEGLEPGDHVAMLMGNRSEFLEILGACLLSGVMVTPVNWHFTAEEAAYVVGDSDARLFIYDDLFADIGEGVAERLPGLQRVVSAQELDGWQASFEPARFDPAQGAAGGAMLYSSGTTGRPKGVYRPAGREVAPATYVAGTTLIGPIFGILANGVHLVTGPLYHSAPLGFGNVAFQTGNTLVLMEDWTAEGTLDLIEKHRVTSSHLVPTMFRRLLALPEERKQSFDASSIQGVLHGAAPCPVPVKMDMIEWWGPVIYEYYGATEGGLTVVDSETWLQHPGTVGRCLPAWQAFTTDEGGRRLPPGETGRIYFQLAMPGGATFEYWKDPDKTANAHLEPGVFTLGDVGRIDEEGFVYLTDRASDMIISGGVNIYPAEAEAVLLTHPAVADAAVFGIPHDDWGEEVKAAIELRAGCEAGEEELIEFCRERLARYKCPRSVDFEESLPRHSTGKLYKRLLRDRYWQGTGRFI